jgi:hypothetical protein
VRSHARCTQRAATTINSAERTRSCLGAFIAIAHSNARHSAIFVGCALR